MTSISFVVPVRNDAENLRRCLASIHSNHYSGRVEIIVVDNGSTDHTTEIARRAGATVLELPEGRVAALRNAGAAQATGDLLAFVDADHIIDAAWILVAVELLASAAIAAAGAPYLPPPGDNWVQRAYDRMRPHRCGTHDVEWLASGNLAVRRCAFAEVAGFDVSLEACEDVDLCNRLRTIGYRIVNDDRLRSVHLGDPSTLRALFVGELWRGRDNVRATLRGPLTLRSLPSLIAPLANILFIAAIVFGALSTKWFGFRLVAWGGIGIGALSVCRAAQMMFNDERSVLRDLAPNLTVACVYNTARALALVLRTKHPDRQPAPARSACT
jgi:glycosyltransferase involved in cell wall biosynthesis